jgi:hypothetical protein
MPDPEQAITTETTLPNGGPQETPKMHDNGWRHRTGGKLSSTNAARRTIQGYEAIHMMRKGQVRWVNGTDVRRQNQFVNKLFELAA